MCATRLSPNRSIALARMCAMASSTESVAKIRFKSEGLIFPRSAISWIKSIRCRPVIGPHDHNRKVFDFPVLNQSERLKKLVEGADAAGHNHEGVGIFYQQRFANKKIMQPDTTIEIPVGCLLEWQLDVASNRATADFFCAAVGRLHDAWAAAGHYRETEPGNRRAHLQGQFVMRIVRFDSRRAEDGYARTNEMKSAISAQEIAHDSQQRAKLCDSRARAFEEYFISALRWCGHCGCRRIAHSIGRSFAKHRRLMAIMSAGRMSLAYCAFQNGKLRQVMHEGNAE